MTMHNFVMENRFAMCAVYLIFPAMCHAQAFNLDLAAPSTEGPSASYGGAANQTGFWNVNFGAVPTQLRDTNAGTTSALLVSMLTGGTMFNFSGGDPDELNMMNSAALFGGGLDTRITISGMTPGLYDVYAYSCGASFDTKLIIAGGISSSDVTITRGGWPGMQVEGRTYAKARLNVTPDANAIFVICTNADPAPLAGIQIVPVPAPGACLFPLAGVIALRRRR